MKNIIIFILFALPQLSMTQSITINLPNWGINNMELVEGNVSVGNKKAFYDDLVNPTWGLWWFEDDSKWILATNGAIIQSNDDDTALPPCTGTSPWTDEIGSGTLTLTGDCIASCTGSVTYTSQGSGAWDVASTWFPSIPPNPLPAGSIIIIDFLDNITLNSSKTINGCLQLEGAIGKITINSGGILTINSGNLSIEGAGALINVKSGGGLTNNGLMSISNNAGARLIVEEGGSFTNTGMFELNGDLQLHNETSFPPGGDFLWQDGEIRLSGPGTITFSNSFSIPTGLTLKLFGELDNNSIISVFGQLILMNASDFDNSSGSLSIKSGGALVFFNMSDATLPDGNFNWQEGGTIENASSTLELNTPLTIVTGRTLKNTGNSSLINNTSITNVGTLINEGTSTIFNNGTISNTGTFTNNWFIKGNGQINGDFTNPDGATLVPGSSPGCFSFGDNFTNEGTLEIELGDGVKCTNYDHIDIIGNGIINGSIIISFVDNMPPSTSTFTILTTTGTLTANPTLIWPDDYTGNINVVGKELQITISQLPVELISFSVKTFANDKVRLFWETASEINNKGFEIQHSIDGKGWQFLTFIDGYGNTIEKQSYPYIDKHAMNGINYYRLKQIDFDGSFEYSDVISVNMLKENTIISIIPNPAEKAFELLLPTHEEAGIVHILDEFGRLVLQSTTQQSRYNVDNLASGFYVVIIELEGKRYYKKLLVD